MAILPVGIGPQEGGYQIERSLRFNSADSAYLSRTPASAGNRKTWTLSFWHKRSKISDSAIQTIWGTPSNTDLIGFDTDDVLRVWFGTNTYNIETTQVFRDVSAWGHWLVSVDTTQATSSNRVKIYYNGAQVTAFSTASYPTQNYDTSTNNTVEHRIGKMPSGDYNYLNGYLSEVNFIDGQALDPTSFGEYNSDTGVWQPKAYTGSYGTNGFYLDFADNSSTTALGYDAAGSNDWTPNNFSVTAGAGNDSFVDTPTPYGTDTGVGGEVRGNYATLNPLDSYDYSGGAVGTYVTDANLKLAWTATAGQKRTFSTIAMPTSGKWYFEVQVLTTSANGNPIGISPITTNTNQNLAVGAATGEFAFECADGNKVSAGTATSYGTAPSTNDVVMCAVDIDNAKIWWGKQGTWFASGDPAAGTNAAFTTLSQTVQYKIGGTVRGAVHAYNFGQRPFAYTAPSGFKALCTQNLPEPTVVDGSTAFNTVLYTGATPTLDINTVGFQPDLVWIKSRSSAYHGALVDSVRGVDKFLYSSLTIAEETQTSQINFDSTGFNVTGTLGNINNSGSTYVAWNWKANGAGVSNTAGTITSTVSANTTAGFSIVTYTGNNTANQTVGHGIGGGVAPSMIIVKNRTSGATSWAVYHASVGVGKYLELNKTDTPTTNSAFFDQVTSTVFGFDAGGSFINASGDNYVAYCFAPVEGYSAFGSYTGNGSSDGPFVYTGFRPRYVMIKKSSAASTTYGWQLYDTSRSPYNTTALPGLWADTSAAEAANTYSIDILSNGFKIKDSNTNMNASGETMIYAAFAENPFKFSLAR